MAASERLWTRAKRRVLKRASCDRAATGSSATTPTTQTTKRKRPNAPGERGHSNQWLERSLLFWRRSKWGVGFVVALLVVVLDSIPLALHVDVADDLVRANLRAELDQFAAMSAVGRVAGIY